MVEPSGNELVEDNGSREALLGKWWMSWGPQSLHPPRFPTPHWLRFGLDRDGVVLWGPYGSQPTSRGHQSLYRTILAACRNAQESPRLEIFVESVVWKKYACEEPFIALATPVVAVHVVNWDFKRLLELRSPAEAKALQTEMERVEDIYRIMIESDPKIRDPTAPPSELLELARIWRSDALWAIVRRGPTLPLGSPRVPETVL